MGKLHFSLICSFYCCLVKEGLALNVSKQIAMFMYVYVYVFFILIWREIDLYTNTV